MGILVVGVSERRIPKISRVNVSMPELSACVEMKSFVDKIVQGGRYPCANLSDDWLRV